MKFRVVSLSSYNCMFCTVLNSWKSGSFKTQSVKISTSRLTANTSASYYEILQVDPDASQDEIKQSFVKLSKQLHPDTNPEQKSHADFVKLNEAYSTLKAPSKRRQYDLSLGNLGTMSSFHEYGRYRTRGFESDDSVDDTKRKQRGRPSGMPFEYNFHDFGSRTETIKINEERRRATTERESDLRASKQRRKNLEVIALAVGFGTLVSLFVTYFRDKPSQKYRYYHDTSVRVFSPGSGGVDTRQKYVDAKAKAARENRRKNEANVKKKKKQQPEKDKRAETLIEKQKFDSLRIDEKSTSRL